MKNSNRPRGPQIAELHVYLKCRLGRSRKKGDKWLLRAQDGEGGGVSANEHKLSSEDDVVGYSVSILK